MAHDAPFFRHAHALVESARIGRGTRVWAFAHVLAGAQIGEDCNICDHVFIENDVVVGDRVTVKCGVQLWDGTTIEDDVFIGPNATFTNDLFPRSRQRPAGFAKTLIREGASIGANATILPGLTIGRHAMVGSGAVVTHDVPPTAIVAGSPARIVGYADAVEPARIEPAKPASSTTTLVTRGTKIISLPHVEGLRGSLSFAQLGDQLPFAPKRYFVIWDVPSSHVRGEHAHRTLQQVLVCLRGSCHVLLDDGTKREEIVLASPTVGLHVPPMIWSVQYKYSADALLLVLASEAYDEADYIRNYEDYLSARK